MTYTTCETCKTKYNRNNEYVHFLSNTHLKHLNQYYCQQCKEKMLLSERDEHLNSDFHKSNKQTYWCQECNKEMCLSTKSKHLKSEKHLNSIGVVGSSKTNYENVTVHENVQCNFKNSSEYNKLVDQQY